MNADTLNKKIDDNKKPLQIVTIGGMILGILTFFTLVFSILHLLFSFIFALGSGINNSQVAASVRANYQKNSAASASSTSSGVANGGIIEAQPVPVGFAEAGLVSSE